MQWKSAVLLLLSALSASHAADPEPVEVVKQTIGKINKDLAAQKADEVNIESVSQSLWGLGAVDLTHGKFGKFSTMVTRLETDQHIKETKLQDNSIQYDFDVSLGLEEFALKFDLAYRFLIIFGGSGTVSVAAKTNTFRLTGSAVTKVDGSCTAFLKSGEVNQLSDYQVDAEPADFLVRVGSWLSTLALNHWRSNSSKAYFDTFIGAVVAESDYQKAFSKILCDALTKK